MPIVGGDQVGASCFSFPFILVDYFLHSNEEHPQHFSSFSAIPLLLLSSLSSVSPPLSTHTHTHQPATMAEPIPGPPGFPILGNINDIDPADSMASLYRLADTYGKHSLFPSTYLISTPTNTPPPQAQSSNSPSAAASASSSPPTNSSTKYATRNASQRWYPVPWSRFEMVSMMVCLRRIRENIIGTLHIGF